ncbi:MAG: DUF362 domain-containing protein [Candidatus Hermodarchaeota archaeon]
MSLLKKCPTKMNEDYSLTTFNNRSPPILHSIHKRERLKNSLLFFGVVNLLWLVFRTGTKPSRIVYPCQRAALDNLSISVSAFAPLSLTAFFTKFKSFFPKSGNIFALLLIIVISSGLVWQTPNPNQEIQLTLESKDATVFPASDIFVVNGRTAAHINELMNLMSLHGLFFYKSSVEGTNQGPDGLIAHNDVVLLKINSQWAERGGTNTDVLKELIQAIVDHPDGFIGEIVVADNGQGYGSMDWSFCNAENYEQSTQDVVNMFSSMYNVSTYDWQPIRHIQVDEYSEADMTSGYILYDTADPETGIEVSYPKFETEYGTQISFKHGIWNGAEYEKRLKVINMPVLKSHFIYGVTASLKNYMGVQSEELNGGLANGHSCVKTGGMGTLIVETGLPSLNIIDAIYVNANPYPSSSTGPPTDYTEATRVNVLMAGVDPVALDYWAVKHVLIQAAELIGYTDTYTLDPDNTERGGLTEAFGVWFNLTKNELLRGGYDVTSNEDRMNVYVYQDSSLSSTSSTTPIQTPGFGFEFVILGLTAIVAVFLHRRKKDKSKKIRQLIDKR